MLVNTIDNADIDMINFNDKLTAVLLENNDETFIRALHNNPGDYVTMLVYADWLEENGRDDTANYWRQKVNLIQNPFDVAAHYQFAELASSLGFEDVAEQHFMIARGPTQNHSSAMRLIDWLISCGRDRYEVCRELIDSHPNNSNIRSAYNRVLNYSGNDHPYPLYDDGDDTWSWVISFDIVARNILRYGNVNDPAVLDDARAIFSLVDNNRDIIQAVTNNGEIHHGAGCFIRFRPVNEYDDVGELVFSFISKQEAFDAIA